MALIPDSTNRLLGCRSSAAVCVSAGALRSWMRSTSDGTYRPYRSLNDAAAEPGKNARRRQQKRKKGKIPGTEKQVGLLLSPSRRPIIATINRPIARSSKLLTSSTAIHWLERGDGRERQGPGRSIRSAVIFRKNFTEADGWKQLFLIRLGVNIRRNCVGVKFQPFVCLFLGGWNGAKEQPSIELVISLDVARMLQREPVDGF
jgi:hypothetical protein